MGNRLGRHASGRMKSEYSDSASALLAMQWPILCCAAASYRTMLRLTEVPTCEAIGYQFTRQHSINMKSACTAVLHSSGRVLYRMSLRLYDPLKQPTRLAYKYGTAALLRCRQQLTLDKTTGSSTTGSAPGTAKTQPLNYRTATIATARLDHRPTPGHNHTVGDTGGEA